jgi:3'-5' exoribonuclease
VGDELDSIFLVRDKIILTTKDGRPYLTVNLVDRTGKIAARAWDRPQEADYIKRLSESIRKNDFVRVTGLVESFKDAILIRVDRIESIQSGEISLEDFLPRGNANPDDQIKELFKIINRIKNPHIKKLLTAFYKDKRFIERFKKAPAAKKLHQAYLGGLLDHTLAIANMAFAVSEHYPEINRDLLVCGAILHDIGKIEELDYERTFDYTDRGRLLGHIVIGTMMIREKMDDLPDFPRETRDMILHLILSHHGSLANGSPVLPAVPEAVILHALDNMDATVWGFITEQVKSREVEGSWTRFSKVYERFIYKGDTFFGLEEEETGLKRKSLDKLIYGLFDDEER